MRDFTLTKYRHLLETITRSDLNITTVHDYLISPPDKCIILRHDVDRAVMQALDMARLEYEYDISSTYYFRYTDEVFNPALIKKIAKLGHEIGYHYEVMDKAKGDAEKSIDIFRYELEMFRAVADIKTICMHGNPLAPWSNRDLWEIYDFNDFGIIGEPYLSIDYNKVLYLTDTGRTWANLNIRVKDVVNTSGDLNNTISVSSTDDIMKLIQMEQISKICLLVHPNRWCDNFSSWLWELLWQNTKNIGKRGIVWYNRRI